MVPGYGAAPVVVAETVVVGVPEIVVLAVVLLVEDDAVPGRHWE